jgi:hypothetical protein
VWHSWSSLQSYWFLLDVGGSGSGVEKGDCVVSEGEYGGLGSCSMLGIVGESYLPLFVTLLVYIVCSVF